MSIMQTVRVGALLLASAFTLGAQVGRSIVTPLAPTLAAVGATNPVGLVKYSPSGNIVYSRHTIQATITGSPTTCTYHVWGTLKAQSENPSFPADYVDLSGAEDCVTNAMVHIVYKPVANVVVQLSALSGGNSPNVLFRYIGEE